MDREIEVRSLPGLTGPVAAGIFRKAIFVPESSAGWTADTWRMVLAHERSHHLRGDPLRRWIAGLAVAVHWFNPLVWWMARRLELQRHGDRDPVVCPPIPEED